MAKLNKPQQIFTHEGARAVPIPKELELRRSVLTCMLWEGTFYEDGVEIADRITTLIKQVKPEVVASLAIEAREEMKLRHVPLLLVREMARLSSHKHLVAETLSRIIQRPDELTEFLAIYWKDKREPLSAQVKKGLAIAFDKFDEYQLAKYDRRGKIKLRDVLFLCHPKPKDKEQADLWKRLIEGNLAIPDTWEVAISKEGNKKEVWERLISEKKLGALAFLRNLRNMKEAEVDKKVIVEGLREINPERVLPFRFISASIHAPELEAEIEKLMLKCLEGMDKLNGKTALVVDGSGSMLWSAISKRSDISRFDAATGLAILLREICEDVAVYVFSDSVFSVPSRRGFALRDKLLEFAEGLATNTGQALERANKDGYDRIIVITDEQSHEGIPNPLPGTKAYFVNVAPYRNGIGYWQWVHIDGWSEAVVSFIQSYEQTIINGE